MCRACPRRGGVGGLEGVFSGGDLVGLLWEFQVTVGDACVMVGVWSYGWSWERCFGGLVCGCGSDCYCVMGFLVFGLVCGDGSRRLGGVVWFAGEGFSAVISGIVSFFGFCFMAKVSGLRGSNVYGGCGGCGLGPMMCVRYLCGLHGVVVGFYE